MAERAPGSTGVSSMGSGEEKSQVKAEILSLAESIVEKAKWLRQNEKEILELVKFVRQAASIIRRASELSGEAMAMLNDLKLHLKFALNIVLHNRQHESYSSVGEAFVCGVDGANSWQKPEDILEVASKIESYVQVLPAVAMPPVPDASIVDDASTIKAEILSLVGSIEATPIKQLLQAVQQAGDMMQNLEASDLSRAPEAMPMLSDLKQHLKDAQDIVDGGAGDSWQQTEQFQVTSKIEDYVQVLPAVVGMRHTSLRDTRTS